VPGGGRQAVEVRVALAWAVCKSKATDWIIQKATELGVRCLQPFWAARSVVKAKDAESQVGKWRRLTVEAAKQCGQNYLPDVREGVSFERMLAASAGHDTRILLDPGARTALREALRGRGGRSVWLAVGPEGGFSPEETAAAGAAGLTPASLGTSILRSETACIAAVACVRYELG
jgi:16S rRNA (uracil1498-N3)-methyltransferase